VPPRQGFCGPVTALCWVPGAEVLLTGRGTDVLAARVAGSQQQRVGTLRLFATGRVHGIRGRAGSGGVLIAAHSEKNVTIAELTAGADAERTLPAAAPGACVLARLWGLDDWVLDVRFLSAPGCASADDSDSAGAGAAVQDGGEAGGEHGWRWLAVGFAHNTVDIWDWKRGARVRRVHCAERPVLFTMALHGDDGDSLVVATGGFTREVLLWQVLGPKSGVPLLRLRGHTGVVHCVRWRSDGRALVSGSEDRSVRVWLAEQAQSEAGVQGSRVPKLVHADSLWGHAARIWDCQISHDTITSVSEDSSGRVYAYKEQELYQRLARGLAPLCAQAAAGEDCPGAGGAQCVSVLKGHQGKHVWKCVICTLASGACVLATGGNDASTKLWASAAGSQLCGGEAAGAGAAGTPQGASEVEHPVQMESYQVPEYPDDQLPLQEQGSAVAGSADDSSAKRQEGKGRVGAEKAGRDEFVRCCALLHGGSRVVCGTNQGRAVLLDRRTGCWTCLYKNSRCQFTAVGVDDEVQMAVLGDARGGLSVVSLTGAFAGYTFSAHQGHVMDVFFRRDACSGLPVVYSGDNAETARGGGAIRRFLVDTASNKLVLSCTIRCHGACRITCLVETSLLPPDAAREGETSGALSVAVLGDRKGSLSVAVLPRQPVAALQPSAGHEHEAVAQDEHIGPAFCLEHAHKKNSVTSLTVHSDGLLYSSGRDGTVKSWRLVRSASGSLGLSKEDSVQGWGGLELISGVAWQRGNHRLLVLGFQHMHFVVWDEPRRSRLWRVDCGGARRPFAYFLGCKHAAAAVPSLLTLAFVRDKQLHVACTQPLAPLHEGIEPSLIEPSLNAADAAGEGAREEGEEEEEGGGGAQQDEDSWFHGREVHQVRLVAPRACSVVQESKTGANKTDASDTAQLPRLLTLSEDGCIKMTRMRRFSALNDTLNVLTSDAARPPAAVAAHACGLGDGSGMELMPEETVQGDRHEQLGAALRCVTTVETSAHGLMILAGGAKDVLLVARIVQPQLPPVAGGGRGAKQTGGKCKLLSTHRVPAAKGMMLRFMALEAFQHPRLGAHVLGVLAAADDGMIRLLFYHVVRKQWHIAGELRSLAPSPTLSPTDPVPRGLLTLGQAY